MNLLYEIKCQEETVKSIRQTMQMYDYVEESYPAELENSLIEALDKLDKLLLQQRREKLSEESKRDYKKINKAIRDAEEKFKKQERIDEAYQASKIEFYDKQ